MREACRAAQTVPCKMIFAVAADTRPLRGTRLNTKQFVVALGALLAVATIASAQTYTIQQIGLFDSAHTQSGGYSNSVLTFGLSDDGAISGTSDRFNGNASNGYD